MKVCNWCNKDVSTVDECSHPFGLTVEYPDGEVMDCIPYSPEHNDGAERCPDCNVVEGKVHHPDCPQEICPRCDGHLASCGCMDEENYYDEEDYDDDENAEEYDEDDDENAEEYVPPEEQPIPVPPEINRATYELLAKLYRDD